MSTAEWIMAAIAGISLLIAVVSLIGNQKKAVQTDAACDESLRADVRYIVKNVEDIRADQRTQGGRIDDHEKRLTRCEESTKSAHKRLDEHIGRNKEE